jgi:hypothetical protein
MGILAREPCNCVMSFAVDGNFEREPEMPKKSVVSSVADPD